MASTQHGTGTGTALIDAPIAVVNGPTASSRAQPLSGRPLAALPIVLLAGAGLLWVLALQSIQIDAIGSLGLVSALPVTFFAALGLLTLSFCISLRTRAQLGGLVAHVVALVLVLHATPSIAYGTLRYAWAWKHVGIVDYFQRNHALWPESPTLSVYHNWPGFFGLVTHLTEAAGLRSALTFASWAPPFFALLNVFALVYVFSALTDDRRVIALAAWFFVLANWVGQEYFAPQAFVYFLYLAVFAIVLRWFRHDPTPKRFVALRNRIRRTSVDDPAAPCLVPEPQQRAPLLTLIVLLMLAIATSHPLTPFVVIGGLCALVLVRSVTVRSLPLIMATMTGAWICTAAWPYVSPNARAIFSEMGAVGSNVDPKLADVGAVSQAQQLVSQSGRGVVVAMALLAAIGFVRRLRVGRLESAAFALMAAPVTLALAGSYGGEVIFRIFLFSLPFAAYLAARAFIPSVADGRGVLTTLAVGVTSVALLTGFCFAYYGKEEWTHFTLSEVRAAEAVFEHAPENSLLVAFDRSLPYQFANYERFTYVWALEEPRRTLERIIADPVDVFVDWLEHPRYAQSYLVISRAQAAQTAALGVLQPGTLETIIDTLRDSGRFDVLYDDADATVFTMTPRPDGEEP